MSDNSTSSSKLRQAWECIKQKDKKQAAELIKSVLREDPNNADALYMASYIASSTQRQIELLNSALQSDPTHKSAKQRLQKIEAQNIQELPSNQADTPLPSAKSGNILTNALGLTESLIQKFASDEQDPRIVSTVYEKVKRILTTGEEIRYIAVRNNPIRPDQNLTPDCVAVTNRRFIVYRPKFLGGAEMTDYLWRDLRDAHLKEGVLRAELSFRTIHNDFVALDNLPKEQARKLYRISQEIEEQMIEERRQREMEERRAGASQIIFQGTPTNFQPSQTASTNDPMSKLKQLKEMLDAGLITQTEFDSKKSEILSQM